MPTIATLLAFAAATILLVALPGPNLIYILTRSVSQGRRAGLVSALGVETGTLIHIVAAVLGLSTVVAASPAAMTVLRWAGVGYLIYLGLDVLFGRSKLDLSGQADLLPLGRVYRAGVLVNVLNPKVVLFFLAFLPQFVVEGAGHVTTQTQMFVFGTVFLALALVMDVGYALAGAGLRRALASRPHYLAAQRYVVMAVYFGLAGYTAFS